jgi:hypothetical protein
MKRLKKNKTKKKIIIQGFNSAGMLHSVTSQKNTRFNHTVRKPDFSHSLSVL